MNRKFLPNRRNSVTFTFEHAFDGGQRPLSYRATIGFHEDGSVGEIFLNSSTKLSTAVDAYARDAAIALSFAIQYGADINVLRKSMTRNPDGSPSSPIGAVLDQLEKL